MSERSSAAAAAASGRGEAVSNPIVPRLLDREAAAVYLSISVDTVDRLGQWGGCPP